MSSQPETSNNNPVRKTKIICTIGPQTQSLEMLT